MWSLAAQVTTTTVPGTSGSSGAFLGDDLLPLLVLAIGGAMVVGTVLAFLRPREPVDDAIVVDPDEDDDREPDLARPPLARSIVFVTAGLVGVIWAGATLIVK